MQMERVAHAPLMGQCSRIVPPPPSILHSNGVLVSRIASTANSAKATARLLFWPPHRSMMAHRVCSCPTFGDSSTRCALDEHVYVCP